MTLDEIVFLSVEHVMQAHAHMLRKYGGSDGVLNPGLLESAVMAPRSAYVNTLAEIAATYTFGIAKNHAFNDGNKRTATLAGIAFLKANGYPVVLDGAIWEQRVVDLVTNVIGRDEFAAHLAIEMGRAIGADGPVWGEILT